MNVIWIVADTFRQDHLGAYGNAQISTPNLDRLAASSTRFDRHYVGGFPTMPARADHATGRWAMSFMGWQPLPDDVTTLAELLSRAGFHTAAVVDTPFYVRRGMNYDRGFQTFHGIPGQEGSGSRVGPSGYNEARDVVNAWRKEADHSVARTMSAACDWLESHHREQFFLYVDTWDPHEPWDAPNYYTERYWPGYDGELIEPPYAPWSDVSGFTRERVAKGHATYMGKISMVDRWVGHLLESVANTGVEDHTAVIFTSDHGFYFGEHGGLFGKMTFAKKPDGDRYFWTDHDARWDRSPLYEEVAKIPLMVRIPGGGSAETKRLSSAVDVMPTVLDLAGVERPDYLDGRSLLPLITGSSAQGREFVVSSIPFANPGDQVRSVDDQSRSLGQGIVSTVTTNEWSLLYSADPGKSELFHLASDPFQTSDKIAQHMDVARELHQDLIRFLRETQVGPGLLTPRSELRM